jgi:uncharacterized protein (UPF0548 family)
VFLLTKPGPEQIRRFLAACEQDVFSYPEVGASRVHPPPGYVVDQYRIQLGRGNDTFTRAVAMLRRWEMFRTGWTELSYPDRPIEVGATVAILASHFGTWSLSACRIVYTMEHSGPLRSTGFAYGTLQEHAERGEERFGIEWNPEDDTVWYSVLAFSQPNHVLVRLGYPVARMLQKRFARDSKAAMLHAIKD